MARAVKTKSGKWQCRGYDPQTKKQRAFTAATKTEAERLARIWAEERRDILEHPADRRSFAEAAEEFIQSRTAVLSPSTIREYGRILSQDLGEFAELPIGRISTEDIQRLANDMARQLAPKTVSNRIGFVLRVLHSVDPEKKYSVNLPKKKKSRIVMPSEAEIRRLLDAAEGKEIEVPIMLALFGPMRRGEISALMAEDIEGSVVHVCAALAKDSAGRWIRKVPKTWAGDRYIQYPDFVIRKLPKSGPVTRLNPNMITHQATALLSSAGLPYTFHQLRHWSVSFLHRQGLSDQEILDRAGWESTGIFKQVYLHSLAEKDRAVAAFDTFAAQ